MYPRKLSRVADSSGLTSGQCPALFQPFLSMRNSHSLAVLVYDVTPASRQLCPSGASAILTKGRTGRRQGCLLIQRDSIASR